MSSVSYKTKTSSAAQQSRTNVQQAQDHTYGHSRAHQDIPCSAYQYHKQKRNESPKGEKTSRQQPTIAPLTSQAMNLLERQPQNKLRAGNDRVIEYRKSSPFPGASNKSPEERQSQMADKMEAWSDKWKRSERK